MAVSEVLQRRVKPRKDEDSVDGELSASSLLEEDDAASVTLSTEEDGSSASSPTGDDQDDSGSVTSMNSGNNNEDEDFHNVSFGALAKAQESLGRRQRPSTSANDKLQDLRERLRQSNDSLKTEKTTHSRKVPEARSNKHAPTVQSSKHAVTRRRVIVPETMPQARDPRFDASTRSSLHPAANSKNYEFLKTYRDSEMAELRTAIKKTKDPAQKDTLKRALHSMESKRKAAQSKEAEAEVLKQHRKKERQAVAEGKNPYYMKRGEVKKEALAEKFRGMSEKKAEKTMERRRKKKAQKERKAMPMARRMAG